MNWVTQQETNTNLRGTNPKHGKKRETSDTVADQNKENNRLKVVKVMLRTIVASKYQMQKKTKKTLAEKLSFNPAFDKCKYKQPRREKLLWGNGLLQERKQARYDRLQRQHAQTNTI